MHLKFSNPHGTQLCYSSGVVGYLLILSEFLQVKYAPSLLLNHSCSFVPQIPAIFGVEVQVVYVGGMLFFFGLYFGVLSRDCSEMCTDRMAASMGYGRKGSMPSRGYDPTVCLLCGDALNYNWALMNSSIQVE